MPTSLVTGGAGFLGSHLCEALLQRGHRVICVDNLVVSSLENIDHLRDDAFTFVNHDVIEPIVCDEPVDFVYHLAALASPVDYLRLPLHSLKTGSYGTHHALGLAQVEARPLPAGVDERGLRRPARCTRSRRRTGATSTRSGRAACTTRRSGTPRRSRWPTTASRESTPRSSASSTPTGRACARTTARAIPTFLRQALEGKPLTVFGDGSQTRSFCYVDDLIRGIVLLAESKEHLPVNLGNPDEKTLLELAEVILRLTGSASEIVLRGSAGRRPASAPAGHHAREADPRLGARDRARGRAAPDDRLARARRRRLRVTDLGERYEEHHRERRDEGDFVFVPERIPLFQAAIGTGKRVLDLGCRSGALTQHFLAGNTVVGLDVDAAALEKAAALGIEPVQANVEEPLPFENASFDAVVAGELFEHLQFPDVLVAEIRRVLLPGGMLVGSVPNAFRVQSRLRFLRGRSPEDDPTHLRMFSPHAIRTLLAAFEDVRIDFVGGRYARIDGRLFGRDLVFTATNP